MLTSEQLMAARGLLRWKQHHLAEALPSVKRLESKPGPLAAQASTVMALQSALEAAGIQFIAENGGGPGVRLKAQP